MTREALMTKLMLLLPFCEQEKLGTHLGANLCDDVLYVRVKSRAPMQYA